MWLGIRIRIRMTVVVQGFELWFSGATSKIRSRLQVTIRHHIEIMRRLLGVWRIFEIKNSQCWYAIWMILIRFYSWYLFFFRNLHLVWYGLGRHSMENLRYLSYSDCKNIVYSLFPILKTTLMNWFNFCLKKKSRLSLLYLQKIWNWELTGNRIKTVMRNEEIRILENSMEFLMPKILASVTQICVELRIS